jgi:hypothetical protein
MPDLLLGEPSEEEELADAMEGIEYVLRLDELGEIDLSPYLTRLLLQLEDALAAARAQAPASPN